MGLFPLQSLEGHRPVGGVGVVDAGAVLDALVVPLPVDRGGIDGGQVEAQQEGEGGLPGFVDHLDRLGKAGRPGTDLLIGGGRPLAVGVSHLGGGYAVYQGEIPLHAPKTASRQIDFFFHMAHILSHVSFPKRMGSAKQVTLPGSWRSATGAAVPILPGRGWRPPPAGAGPPGRWRRSPGTG